MAKAPNSNGPKRPRVQKLAQRRKTGTTTTRNHRFESFSQRISKLNIDPIRRSDAKNRVHDENEASHFISALERWKDSNLSEGFTDFVSNVDPLCQSLPQIIHYESTILEHLFTYLERADALCLEPLLNLVTHLAHDLGSRFESHFEKTVTVVSKLAAHHESIEVIEWSFTCLAWLFKYLSRLLVPDLRPLYDLMAPLLGKQYNKSFIGKFSAESMSFLVRKAGAQYHSNRVPLDTIIAHAFHDLSQTDDEFKVTYQQGLTVLFAESIKGVQRGAHTGGSAIIGALISHLMHASTDDLKFSQDLQLVVESVIIDTIHFMDSQGFAPILNAFLEHTPSSSATISSLTVSVRLLLVIVATRKGTRIAAWSAIVKRLGEVIDWINSHNEISSSLLQTTFNALAVTLQYSPFDFALPLSQSTMRYVDNGLWSPHFLEFSIFLSELGRERFEALVMPTFQKFIISNWKTYDRELCHALPTMSIESLSAKCKIRLPQEWQDRIQATLKSLHNTTITNGQSELLSSCYAYLRLLESVESDPDFSQRVANDLLALARAVLLEERELRSGPFEVFTLCRGLRFAIKVLGADSITAVERSRILTYVKVFGQRPGYLRVLSNIMTLLDSKLDRESSEVDAVAETLLDNLASPSHELRELSLAVFAALYPAISEAVPQALVVAQEIEDSPFTVESARGTSLKIRNLASIYANTTSRDPWLAKAIVAHSFGLLHVRLTPIWEDVCNSLHVIASTEDSETLIMDRAILWLKDVPPSNDTQRKLSSQNDHIADIEGLPGFQCTNLSHVDELSVQISKRIKSTHELRDEVNATDLEPIPTLSTQNRPRSLRVLSTMPQAAEKRSRALVPILLDWAASLNYASSPGEGTETDSETLGSHDSPPRHDSHKWSRKDQKALLELFARFVNPSVLFRSNDVHHALLELLCNGDIDIQKSALKALLTWKTAALTPYRENLFNILDDARFREEVTTFLDDEDGSVIRQEHRSALIPILLRLLYGRVTTRSGLGNARGSQEARRKAVLTSLSRFGQDAIEEFAAIALGPLKTISGLFDENGMIGEEVLARDVMPLRRQTGMLRMLRDMLETLPDQMEPSSRSVADAVIYCLIKSSRLPSSASSQNGHQDESMHRSVRQEAYSCLVLLFSKYPEGQWIKQIEKPLFDIIIAPKLEKLALETAQAPSSLLKLFSAWGSSVHTTRLLFEPNNDVLVKVADCLIEPSAKLEVRRYVLKDVIKPFLDNAISGNEGVLATYLHNGLAHTFFTRMAELLRHTHEKDCLQACVEIFIQLQPFVSGFQETKDIIGAALHFLSEPSRTVSPRLKGQILELLQHFLPKHEFENDSELYTLSVRSLSKLFGFFHDGQNRSRLIILFDELAKHDSNLRDPAQICRKLNSYSDIRLGEPNYEDRGAAFQVLNDQLWSQFGPQQWFPIVHNILFLIRDKEEFSTRSSASAALRRFIQATALESTTERSRGEFLEILNQTIIPAIQAGIKEESELVRNEYIAVLAEMVNHNVESVKDMKCLLSSDEEASFFNNIFHIQPHRRNRALQRLSTESAKLSSLNIGRFFIPLLETIIADKDAEAHNLATEAVKTLEYLAQGLEWNRYRALVQRMVQDPQRFTAKLRIRALGSLLTGLYQAHIKRRTTNGTTVDEDQDSKSNMKTSDTLLTSLPDEAALQRSLFNSVFSKLLDQIHYQDEASLDIRILVAIYAVKLVLVFPADEINNHLPAVLVDMCNVLKSRAQEARDSTRKTLADIAAIIGPLYFGFIIKQLRSSLKRGYQLHVLSYTVHSLLMSVSGMFKIGSIDYCLPDLVAVVMDDAFGITGQDKEAKGYVSSMREVKKKALGFDSMEILATMITLPQVSTLLKPIGMHLERPKPRIEKADELFRRIREGLRRNECAKSRDILMLSFELMTEAIEDKAPSQELSLRPRKITGFSLELLRRVLDKHEDLKTPQNLAGFLPIFDELAALSDEEIQMSLFRLLASVIKVPLKELDDYAGIFVHRAKETIENSSSTNEPLAQAALRLISAILRERPAAMISKANFEIDIGFLLKKITPDLQEPARLGERDRQVAAFNFMKAIMARGVVIKEVYETMDTVREVMITSQEAPIPDLARGVYSRFILDYFTGEGKGVARQLDFLTTNLQYEHARGRKSVMEVIAFVFNKMESSAVQPVLVSFFLPLVLVLIVDGSEDCRVGAELLLRKVFERADKERAKIFKSQMLKWQRADANILWRKAVLRVWELFFDVHPTAASEARTVHSQVCDNITVAVVENDAENHDYNASRTLLLDSLELYKSLCSLFPSIAFATTTTEIWFAITSHLTSEDHQVRATSAHLISVYFADFARASSQQRHLPMSGSHGLTLTSEGLYPIVESGMHMLSLDANIPEATETTIQNLAFAGRVSRGTESDSGILETLLQKSAAILRAETDPKQPPRAKLASLELVAALCTAVPADAILPFLHDLLLPLHHLCDTEIAAPQSSDPLFGEVHAQLVTRAQEVMELLRETVGAAPFMAVMARVQKTVRARREGRRAKRAVEAISEPEKVGLEKRRKREREKEKRRERNQHAAGMRRGW